MAALLEKELKQPFTVVNRTGGSGVVGYSAIAAGMLLKVGMKPDQIGWIASDGAASGLKERVAGSIQVSTVAPAAASTLIKSGKVRLLAA